MSLPSAPHDSQTLRPRRADEDCYRQLFQTAPYGLILADATTGEIIAANRSILHILACPENELLGTSIRTLPMFRDAERWREICDAWVKSDDIQNEELSLKDSNGRTRTFDLVASAFGLGPSRSLHCCVRDVTSSAEQNCRDRQHQKQEALRLLAGGMAHDINNVLTCIRGYASIAIDEPGLSSELRDILTQVEAASARAAAYTRRYLDFARLESPQRRAVELHAFLRQNFASLQQATGTATPLRLGPVATDLRCSVDEKMLTQALLHLVRNAHEASATGGEIVVAATAHHSAEAPFSSNQAAASPQEEWIRLSVSDRGRGMSATTLEHLFEPGFSTKKTGGGNGMGLAMVYHIAAAHGGWTAAESSEGQGSTVSVFLPRLA